MDVKQLENRKKELLESLNRLGDMRRGSLQERYIPCGKKGCRCTKPGNRGHGPNYSLTWKKEGKTITRYIGWEQVGQVREQIEERHEFQRICDELLRVSDELSDARLGKQEDAKEGAKKNSRRS